MLGRSAFIRFLDLEVVSLDTGREELVLRMPMRPELERGPGSGQFHGGPIAAFVDVVGDYRQGRRRSLRHRGWTAALSSDMRMTAW